MPDRVLGNDDRPICGIYGPEKRWQIETNEQIDHIEAYIEDGNIPWFAIYSTGEVVQRINSVFVESVVYG